MGSQIGFNEGDYIKTRDGVFFAVKGSIHEETLVTAILRYMPDPDGSRVINGERYRRVYDIGSSTEYLKSKYPVYMNHIERVGLELQSVPTELIAEYYDPKVKLAEIISNQKTGLDQTLSEFVFSLSKVGKIPLHKFGVSGSLLIGAQTPSSDIDLNVYGEESIRAYSALKRLRNSSGHVKPLDGDLFENVLRSRWSDTGIDLDCFRDIERNKVLHGTVNGIEYFMRLLIPDELHKSKPIEKITFEVKIIDASNSIYNPCTYQVHPIDCEYEIVELKSYRGKFTEHARKGDVVMGRGTLERVMKPSGEYYRVMLGGPRDYILPKIKDNY